MFLSSLHLSDKLSYTVSIPLPSANDSFGSCHLSSLQTVQNWRFFVMETSLIAVGPLYLNVALKPTTFTIQLLPFSETSATRTVPVKPSSEDVFRFNCCINIIDNQLDATVTVY